MSDCRHVVPEAREANAKGLLNVKGRPISAESSWLYASHLCQF